MSDSLKRATPDEASDADGPGGGAGGGPDAARASSAHAPEEEACVKPKKSGKRHVGLMTQFGLTGNETVVKLDGKVAAFITDASFVFDLAQACPGMTELSLKGNQISNVDRLAELLADKPELVSLHVGKHAFRRFLRV